MNKKTMTIVGVIAAILIVGGVVWALNNNKTDDTAENAPTPAPAAQSQTTEETPSATVMSATITYTNDGFTPDSLTVSRGATITVKNDSSRTIQFDSDPHPQHTDNPELNVNGIPSGKSMSFVVDKTGTWGYHDHLKASEKGTIVVQ